MKVRSIKRPGVAAATAVAMLVTAVAIAFLFSPMPEPSEWRALCIRVLPVSGRMKLVMNCDSPGFVALAHDPAGVLRKPGSQWQSRPGYGVLGWVAAQPLRIVNRFVRMRTPMFSSKFEPFYFGFILINWVLLAGSGVLFLRLVGADSPLQSWVVLPMSMLIVNIVTKPFFWTPHLQIFNVFVPLLAIFLCSLVAGRWKSLSTGRFALLGLLLGLASLTYGAFLLCTASVTIALLCGFRRAAWSATLARILAMWVAFIVPPVLWRQYVIRTTGSFYMHETDYYKQFVWIGEAIAKGWGVTQTRFSTTFHAFLDTLPAVVTLPLAALAITAIILGRITRKRARFPDSSVTMGAACFLIVAIPFYALMGFYQERLSWILTVPLIVVLALVLGEISDAFTPRARRYFGLTLGALALGYAVYIVATPGPYS